MKPGPMSAGRTPPLPIVASLAGLGAGILWGYWPALSGAADRWAHDPRYSHGYLVPAFALAVLWHRRRQLAAGPLRPTWWGLPLLLAGEAARLAAAYFHYQWFGLAALVPSLAGVCLLLGGWQALAWAWPAIGFLLFMVPLPYRLEVALAQPLQRGATAAGTYCLQTLGLPAAAQGTVIVLKEARIEIVDACSGLSMLVSFVALSTALAMVTRRPMWEKAILVAGSFPIALAANMVRITATGVLHETAGPSVANAVFHDLSGWLMMPLALGMLWLVQQILANLFVEPAAARPIPIHLAGADAARPTRPGSAGAGHGPEGLPRP